MSVPATPPAGGSSTCWNCHQPLQAGSAKCLWCGVSQQAEPAALAVPPGGIGAPPAGMQVVQAQAPGSPQAFAAPAAPQQRAAAAPRAPRVQAELGPAFAGAPAGVGARLAAFTVDLLVVAAVATAVFFLTSSAIFTALAVVELAIGLWVIESRTGITVGNALLRIRTSRVDAPFTPGVGRGLVRALVTGVGFLVAAIGAWVVVASAAWDSSGLKRSWADKAGRTVVVSVPRRRVVASAPAQSAPMTAQPSTAWPTTAAPAIAPAPGVQQQNIEPLVLAAPQVISTSARRTAVDDDNASTGTRQGEAAFSSAPVPQADPVSETIIRDAEPSRTEGAAGTLLLIFDTGQREQLSIPVAVNLGRNPIQTEATDRVITVHDPESTVSKTHLRLEHSRGRTWVTDGASTNGSDLLEEDGDVIPLVPGERVLLEEGTRVRIGNRVFTISVLLGSEKA